MHMGEPGISLTFSVSFRECECTWGEPGILGSRLTREHKCVYIVSTITSESGNCHNYNFSLLRSRDN